MSVMSIERVYNEIAKENCGVECVKVGNHLESFSCQYETYHPDVREQL